MAELNLREDPIGRTVLNLDLRGTKTAMEMSRRTAPKPAFGGSGHFSASPMASSHARSPARPTSAAPATRSPKKLDAITALPYASGTPTEAAAALAYFQTLEKQRDEAVAKNAALEESLTRLVSMFADHASAVEASVGPLSQFFTVTFGPGHVGMILTSDDAGNIEVAELRDDRESGRPLLAKASGKIFVGDHVLAVNGRLLSRFGPPTPEQVAAEFRAAARPMTVLFKRNAEARLRAALASSGAE